MPKNIYLDYMVEGFIKDMERNSRTMEEDLKELKTAIENLINKHNVKDITVYIEKEENINAEGEKAIIGRNVILQIEV